MQVDLKRRNGWKTSASKVDSHDDVKYGMVKETQVKQVAVLVRGRGDYKCSKCKHHDPETNCKHEQAVADAMGKVPA